MNEEPVAPQEAAKNPGTQNRVSSRFGGGEDPAAGAPETREGGASGGNSPLERRFWAAETRGRPGPEKRAVLSHFDGPRGSGARPAR